MTMIPYLIKHVLFLVILSLFSALSASQIVFNKVSDRETILLQSHLIFFYSQELLKAGLFTDQEAALEAAQKKVLEQTTNSSLQFFCLALDACKKPHVGYIAYSIDADMAYIESIYIDEKYHGQGLGKETLLSLENELRNQGIHLIKLYVFAHNQAACNLYNTMGYVIEKSYFNQEIPIGYSMQKTLIKE